MFKLNSSGSNAITYTSIRAGIIRGTCGLVIGCEIGKEFANDEIKRDGAKLAEEDKLAEGDKFLHT